MLNKLSAMSFSTLSSPGNYGDGGGLWLQVSGPGSKSWTFRFTLVGRRRVCEHALTHSLPDRVETAYRRGDLLEQRIVLMQALGRLLLPKGDTYRLVRITPRSLQK